VNENIQENLNRGNFEKSENKSKSEKNQYGFISNIINFFKPGNTSPKPKIQYEEEEQREISNEVFSSVISSREISEEKKFVVKKEYKKYEINRENFLKIIEKQLYDGSWVYDPNEFKEIFDIKEFKELKVYDEDILYSLIMIYYLKFKFIEYIDESELILKKSIKQFKYSSGIDEIDDLLKIIVEKLKR
jgi:hypothetical protein